MKNKRTLLGGLLATALASSTGAAWLIFASANSTGTSSPIMELGDAAAAEIDGATVLEASQGAPGLGFAALTPLAAMFLARASLRRRRGPASAQPQIGGFGFKSVAPGAENPSHYRASPRKLYIKIDSIHLETVVNTS